MQVRVEHSRSLSAGAHVALGAQRDSLLTTVPWNVDNRE